MRNRAALRIVYVLLALAALYKSAMFIKENVTGFRADTLVVQQDYDNFPVTSYEIGTQTIYIPVEGDRTGYDAFPSSPWEMNISLRGSGLEAGFKPMGP